MGYPAFFTILTVLLISIESFPQIIFKNFPDYKINANDSAFFDLNSRRSIIPLNGEWTIYQGKEKENAKKVVVPSVFSGEGELVFQKAFNLSESQISEHKMEIHFLGINYTADISVNDNIIYRHPGGEYPFRFDLPKDILFSDKRNIISVKLSYFLDSENTIPVKQRFMFPNNFGGIVKDVFIKMMPNISISDIDLSYAYSPERNSVNFRLNSKIENREFRKDADTIPVSSNFSYRVRFTSPGNVQGVTLNEYNFTLGTNGDHDIKQSADLASPVLWSPSSPQYYTVSFELFRGNDLIDRTSRRVSVYDLNSGRDSLTFNGQGFKLNGVTYVPSFYGYGSLYSYEMMERDIKLIKETGFNSVRFTKSVPHPYLVYQCEKLGLLAFIEIPVNSVPSGLADDLNFMTRSKGFLGNLVKAYKDYSNVAAIGVGSSLIPKLDGHITYINEMTSFLKGKNEKTYASFASVEMNEMPGLDFYGIELFNTPVNDVAEQITSLQQQIGAGRIFISSATYVVNAGNTNGYVNEHSFEAQAKYFEDLIQFSQTTPLSGFFINTMFDYRGDYPSLVSGYTPENLYRIGVAGENRVNDRLGYKIIYAKLNNTEVPTIPIGSKKDSSPMVFIIFGLAIALLIGILINSGRKFREDASRALLRPYNFYADVRDQRIMSGFQATLLALIISCISALLLSNLLFYFRQEIKFEKLLLAFGNKDIMDTVSWLAWNPGLSLLWLSFASLAALVVITILVKFASFFVRNRVYLSGIYYVVVWSFLPLALLIPVGIILFRLLEADYTNLYVFAGLLLFTFWILYRLLKGIYVIFDVNPGSVYFYSFVFILVVIGGVLFYYEIQNSVLSYLTLTIKQYKLFG
jgi:beta-galactosidase